MKATTTCPKCGQVSIDGYDEDGIDADGAAAAAIDDNGGGGIGGKEIMLTMR